MPPHPFDLVMQLETRDIRLDCAALQLARDAYPHLPTPSYLSRLDRIAEDVADTRPGLSAILRYQAMREVLVGHYGLRGNHDDYYDPDNNYLNRVLDRRLGIPISLSIVWLAVAQRLKWPVTGLGLPGHFIVRFDDEERFVLVDPFSEGRTLTMDDCHRILDHYFEGKVSFSPVYLRPVDARAVLARMLRNLRSIYLANQDWRRASSVVRRLIAVEPEDGRHFQDLAGLLCRIGDAREAHACLTAYLRRQPAAADRLDVRQKLAWLEATIAALN